MFDGGPFKFVLLETQSEVTGTLFVQTSLLFNNVILFRQTQ